MHNMFRYNLIYSNQKNDKCFCGTETAAEVYTLQNSHQPKQCLNLLFLVWHKTFNSWAETLCTPYIYIIVVHPNKLEAIS